MHTKKNIIDVIRESVMTKSCITGAYIARQYDDNHFDIEYTPSTLFSLAGFNEQKVRVRGSLSFVESFLDAHKEELVERFNLKNKK